MTITRKNVVFLFFLGQIILGFGLFLNPIPFDVILRLFGMFLIALSPLWLVMFRIERIVKQKEDERKNKKELK